MKKHFLIILCVITQVNSYAQTFDVNGDYKISGKLGIGTTSPLGSLHVSKAGADAWVYFTNNLNGSNNPVTNSGLSFGWNYSGGNGESIINYNTSLGGRPRLIFTSYNGTILRTELTIQNGNVGIGTDDPNARLQLNADNDNNNALRLQVGKFSMNGTGKFSIDANGIFDGRFVVKENGNVGIGAPNPDSKLTVAGNIHSREVTVTIDAGSDFVFEDNYELKALNEVEQFIKQNRHLPDIESAKDMEENGLALGKMDMKLLQKIEELTLYMIDFKKEMDKIKEENQYLKERIIKLEKD